MDAGYYARNDFDHPRFPSFMETLAVEMNPRGVIRVHLPAQDGHEALERARGAASRRMKSDVELLYSTASSEGRDYLFVMARPQQTPPQR